MRQVFLGAILVAWSGMMVGCASECEKKCDAQYSQAKELAGGNWGALEKTAKVGLAACKAACDDG